MLTSRTLMPQLFYDVYLVTVVPLYPFKRGRRSSNISYSFYFYLNLFFQVAPPSIYLIICQPQSTPLQPSLLPLLCLSVNLYEECVPGLLEGKHMLTERKKHRGQRQEAWRNIPVSLNLFFFTECICASKSCILNETLLLHANSENCFCIYKMCVC